MGTSSEDRGGAGGNWKPAKLAATSFTKHGGRDRAGRAVGRLITALGGAGGITAAARGGRLGAQRLGALYAATVDGGLEASLRRLGLAEFIGRSAEEVVEALIDYIGGVGETREGQAARSAACDVFEALAETDSFDDLERQLLELGRIQEVVGQFLAAYIYHLVLPVIDERLDRLGDDDLKQRRDREARETILEMVRLRLSEHDLDAIDWTEEPADAAVANLMGDCLASLEDLGE